MNVKLLQQVKAHILEEPRRFFMSQYVMRDEPGALHNLDGRRRKMPSCGTAACIGGWAVILTQGLDAPYGFQEGAWAAKISKAQANRLFLIHEWPERFRKAWKKADMVTRATIAAKRIDHFIATNGTK